MRETIGHYRIVGPLGRGGMGVVYKAHEQSLNRFVAIKELSEQLSADEGFVKRFKREAQAAAGLSHPNIVQIHYIGEEDGQPYFVMEYVSGRSLDFLVRQQGAIGNPKASQMILQAAHGLAAAHDRGIIHRDIKPANLMLDDQGIVKIADFGLALPLNAVTKLTAAGKLMGTAGYFAPEQCRGEQADHRTDIYALGVSYFELLTGQLPFRAESPLALMKQIIEDPPDIETLGHDVDADSRRILARMIAKNREDRYQNCHELVADLEDYLAKCGVRSATAGLSASASAPVPMLDPAAREAATEVVGGEIGAAPTAQIVAATAASPTRPGVTQPSAPLAGAPTQPSAPMAGAATQPSAPLVAVPADIANQGSFVPPAAAPRKRSRLVTVLAVVFVLFVVGGIGAAVVAYQVFKGAENRGAKALIAEVMKKFGSTSSQPVAESAALPQTAKKPANPGVLLTKPVENSPLPDTAVPASTPAQEVSVPAAAAAPAAAAVAPSAVAAADRRPSASGRQAAANYEAAPVSAAPLRTAHPIPQPRQEAPPPLARPALSGVAVAVTGEAPMSGAVANVLTSEIEAAGLHAVDAETLPAIEDVLRGGDVTASQLLGALRREGKALLVFARVEPAGERQLRYMGRSGTAYSSRVTVTAYDIASGRPVGSRSSATVEYTPATVDREAEKIIGPLARSVAGNLQAR